MSRSVDVLAVMDNTIACLRNEGFGATEDDEARAAVAELIEAADGVLRWESGDGRTERQRLRAALARVTGAEL